MAMGRTGHGLAGAALATLLAGCSLLPGGSSPTPSGSEQPSSASVPSASASEWSAEDFALTLDPQTVLDDLRSLESIAKASRDNRVFSGEGYVRSAEYVEEQLRAAGYEPWREPVQVVRVTSTASSFSIDGDDVPHDFLTNSPALPEGGVSATLVSAGLGCAASDYPAASSGAIALVDRGECSFAAKSTLAKAAGALAVVIVNTESRPVNGTLGNAQDLVPTVGVGSGVRSRLADAATAGTPIQLSFDVTREVTDTFNVLAETQGDPEHVLMVGAHLDGVDRGPGINDNGSGSASILEVARGLAASGVADDPSRDRVRFAWWTAEEIGLVGSNQWVEQRSDAELAVIDGYLNFDMVASGNYVIGVYDGAKTSPSTGKPLPEGSAEIKAAFTDWFDGQAQPWIDQPMDGYTDYVAFMLADIPVGGLFTGAGGSKSEEEAATFGGIPGAAYDQHYHQVGDTVANLSSDALAINLAAIGAVVWELSAPA